MVAETIYKLKSQIATFCSFITLGELRQFRWLARTTEFRSEGGVSRYIRNFLFRVSGQNPPTTRQSPNAKHVLATH